MKRFITLFVFANLILAPFANAYMPPKGLTKPPTTSSGGTR